ncbi:FKBP-type peptidyl-prolyl cis-trans isomerase FklB [Pseudomonas coronafaciens pv. atropurpurea]|nr:Peptidyl-prolyl cis-trans isomerase [Pseudomonas coronafaciens pv. atropurpurea]RMT57136.1 FKBP-type peptidyl-prolyl cis-trans isomerase FklB [Pseudomonas coronafaciens pv. atropurpurea]
MIAVQFSRDYQLRAPLRSSVMSEVNLSTDETRVSYGIGRQLGDQLRENPPPGVNLEAIVAGLRDAFGGQPSRVGQEEMSASFKVIREIMQAEAAAKAEQAAGAGKAYLAENAKREGVTTLASGLQFEVLTAGDGAKPTREDQVRVHYHGTLIDGTVFDSSYDRGEPAEFPVSGVIAGWTEALQLMNSGSKWRVYVPSELAYGAQGVGSIAPHSVLVFDVELLDVL